MKTADYIDFYQSLALGIDGFETVNVSGFSNSDFIIPGDVSIKSDDSSDKMTVIVKGLLDGCNETDFKVKMEGLKKINLGYLYRINSIECVEEVNAGLITCGDYSVLPGVGRGEYAIYSVPIGNRCFIMSVSSPNDSDIELRVNGTRQMIFNDKHKWIVPYEVKGMSDISFTSKRDVYVNMELLLIKPEIIREV